MTGIYDQIDQTKYEVLEKLREGGMGAIFKVRHRALDQIRVIKVLLSDFSSDSHFQERFLQEARLACRMSHPNIAQIHDFHLDDGGTAFLVMEFIQGSNLAQLLQQGGPPDIDLAMEISAQSLQAIDYLHGQELVHRDISPDNLMLTQDVKGRPLVKLIDLGIAKSLQREKGLTATGLFLGKLHYASPEQFGGTDRKAVVAPASDLYSFGVVLYQLLTGELPFQGTDSQIMAGHLFHPPRVFEEVDRDHRVPDELRAIVLKALAKNPEERFDSAEEFAVTLQKLRQGPRPRDESDPAASSADERPNQPASNQAATEMRASSFQAPGGKARIRSLLAGAEKLAELGQIEEATLQLETILSIEPNYEDALQLLTRIKDVRIAPILGEASRLFVERRFDEALECLEKAREIDPGSERIQRRMAEIAAARQRKLEAETREREEKKLKVSIAQALDRGDLEEATTLLESAGAEDTDPRGFATLRRRLAEIREHLAHERANELTEQARKSASDTSLDAAIELCKEALEIAPRHLAARELLADLEGRREKARQAQQIAAIIAKIESEVAGGDLDAADTSLQQARSDHGDSKPLRDLQSRITGEREERQKRERARREEELLAIREAEQEEQDGLQELESTVQMDRPRVTPAPEIRHEQPAKSKSWMGGRVWMTAGALAILGIVGITLVIVARGGGEEGAEVAFPVARDGILEDKVSDSVGGEGGIESAQVEDDASGQTTGETASIVPDEEKHAPSLPAGESELEGTVTKGEPAAPAQIEEPDSDLLALMEESRSLLSQGDLEGALRAAGAAELRASAGDPKVQKLWIEIAVLARRRAVEEQSRASSAGAPQRAPDPWSRAEAHLADAKKSIQSGDGKQAARSWIESRDLFEISLSQARTAAEREQAVDPLTRELESLRDGFASVAGDEELERDYARRIAELDPDDPIVEMVRARDRQASMDRALEFAREGNRERFEEVWDEHARVWPEDPLREFFLAEALAVLEESEREAQRVSEVAAETELAESSESEELPPSFQEPRSGIRFRLVPAGEFRRGCTKDDFNCFDDEKPSLTIQISSAFYLAEVEITNGQYLQCVEQGACTESDHQKWLREGGRRDHPVTDVTWTEASTFCDWAGGRLPTEAEWEYSARGGAPSFRFPWGNQIDPSRANYTGSGDRDQWLGTSPGASFAANGYGLFDMSGNVREWVADWYSSDYYRKGSRQDPQGATSGGYRVIRDGSWYDSPMVLRVSFRHKRQPKFTRDWLGFRCAHDRRLSPNESGQDTSGNP